MTSGWLTTINPLAKILAIVPPMIALLLTRGIAVPAAVAAVALAGILTGVRLRPRTLLIAAGTTVLFAAWMSVFFAVLVRADRVAQTPLVQLGPLAVPSGALAIGLGTALRFVAMMMLALLGSLGTTLAGLRSALVLQARVPYRFAYGVVATVRFVPRYRENAATIRAAHRARGVVESRGPVGAIRRAARSFLPLLADGARYAERMSLAMDARGFGAHPHRIDRNPTRLRPRDIIFVATLWAAVAAIYVVALHYGLVEFAEQLHQI